MIGEGGFGSVFKGWIDEHTLAPTGFIALDVAKGLAFLQNDEVNVIHGDLKTSKIMIDSINRSEDDDDNDDDIELDRLYKGFVVYAAPEYIMTGGRELTKKSDVYSFGVVLLEIMLGKRALDKSRSLGEQNLVDWANFSLISKCNISQAMDDYIEGEYSSPEAMKIAHIVIQCLSTRPKYRPNIHEVVRSLETLQNSNDTNSGVGSS
nr:nodulation protein [Melilotus officinalis]